MNCIEINNKHLSKFYICFCTILSAENYTQMNWVVGEYRKTRTQTSNLYQLPQCIMNHTSPHLGLKHSVQFQIIFLLTLLNNSQAAILLILTSTSKLQVFFKVKYHIYYSIYVSLNQLTWVKEYYHFY